MGTRSKIGNLDNLTHEVQEMIDMYQETVADMREHEKAVMEREIWNSLSPDNRRMWSRQYFLRAALGGSTACYDSRCRLLNGGDDCDELWRRIRHEKMPVRTAVSLLQDARKNYINGGGKASIGDALVGVIDQYDKRPSVRVLSDGRIVRQHNPQATPGRKKARQRKRATGSKVPETPKEMYRAVRQLVAAYVSRQLDDLDEETAEQIYSDFEIDLKLTLDSLKTRIRNRKVTQEKLQSLTKATLRKRLRDAFDELGMEVPKPRDIINVLKIKKRYHKLASVYHPDKHGDDPDIKESLNRKFQAVTEAYHYICSFVEHQATEQKDEE